MANKSNASMVFYRSFYESIKTLGKANRLAMYDAIIEYGLNGDANKLSISLERIFIGVKAQIDANNHKREQKIASKLGMERTIKRGERPLRIEQNPSEYQFVEEDLKSLREAVGFDEYDTNVKGKEND